ncbi:type III polyketide synthase [Microbacterium imperiale]|uniref:Naringenin-chalcone synthase n=1 Tax=Microbacterium imperiale TaxID=33884 RepID=A0A9W6HHI5_9MICO|nr:type III polyketide synthase [Microbacterium imperiale]MBP2421325.1 putative naringenin-chalcone synthase [Microbacterium imperiale]MDS0199567.1 type III polyketide synthase [Microbacterium imperiale]BFE41664.1 type III polyketide synthase [Microbacterium imperiale]GLJ80615.1 naringenin-chalcone synthase [Microbacterium imperiale]
MTARILSIGTAVPPAVLEQDAVRDLFASQPGIGRLSQRLVRAAFDASAIETRHTVLTELADALAGRSTATLADDPATAAERLPVVDDAGRLLSPPTGARNDTYIATAPALFADAARQALAEASVDPADVTHVVTVSCTGMFAPGPDYRLVRDLGLPTSVERYHLGFIGCAAAVPALRAAARMCAAQPEAVVLVVCAELCTLHFRVADDPDQILAASLFADGAAAAVVSADPSRRGERWLDLERFATAVTDDGERDMTWTIGDAGFEMVLSAEVPRIIGREIRDAVDGFLGGASVDTWAVHPGGRAVVDRVEAGLGLPADALATSRAVLRDYGNMSSATILFILRSLLQGDDLRDGETIATLAFGPGLTMEAALLTAGVANLEPVHADAALTEPVASWT